MLKQKIVLCLLIGILVGSLASMGFAADITFSIDVEKAINPAEQFLGKIPQIPDPEWIDPKDGSIAPLVNEYTDQEYVEKWIVEYTREQERHFRQSERWEAAQNAEQVDEAVINVKK